MATAADAVVIVAVVVVVVVGSSCLFHLRITPMRPPFLPLFPPFIKRPPREPLCTLFYLSPAKKRS